jgi:hypothetical protein
MVKLFWSLSGGAESTRKNEAPVARDSTLKHTLLQKNDLNDIKRLSPGEYKSVAIFESGIL